MKQQLTDIGIIINAIQEDIRENDRQLAKQLGVDRVYLPRLRWGDRIPQKVIEQVCTSLEINRNDFFNAGGMPIITRRDTVVSEE